MAIKANVSSQGGEFKKYVGVASFRIAGVNPTKAELEKFYGREIQNEPEYLKEKQDAEGKSYKAVRISFMIVADDPASCKPQHKETIRTNKALSSPYKTMVSFFLSSRYLYNKDKSKVKVIDKFGRTAWVTVEQARNHQIPVYKNGPARIDAGYRPVYMGEEELTTFIDNYLNITPIETYNKNTGEWITNPHPEDCEGWLEGIKDYFTGDVSKIKEYCGYIPDNHVKLLVGVQTDGNGRQYNTVYSSACLRNGSKSYTHLKDSIDGNNKYLTDNGKEADTTIWSNDASGVISDICEYAEDVKETNLDKPKSEDPFAQAAALPEDELPFGDANEDPFAELG
jgi:hypothetical protein